MYNNCACGETHACVKTKRETRNKAWWVRRRVQLTRTAPDFMRMCRNCDGVVYASAIKKAVMITDVETRILYLLNSQSVPHTTE